MKKMYRTPKAVFVDFAFDEQVKAASVDVSDYQDPPPKLNRCRQFYSTDCSHFFQIEIHGEVCASNPYSLRPSV